MLYEPIRNLRLTGVALAAMGLALAGSASAATLTPIASFVDPAGGVTNVLDINNSGFMTGSIGYADGSSLGFSRDAAGVYTTFSVDFATQGRAISNANVISGYATDATSNLLTDTEFTRSPGGAVTALQNPLDSSFLHGIAQGMNDLGALVGDYFKTASQRHGFILNGSSFIDIALPGQPNAHVAARGVNNAGTVAGWAIDAGVTKGFLDSGGVLTLITHPGATGTYFEDINNHGLVAGEYADALGAMHAFLYNTGTGVFTDIDVPGAANSQAFGLNDLGFAVINTDLARGPNNFLYGPAGVPEPGTWLMLIAGVFGAGAALRRRRSAQAA